jgi:hypothetical protein
VGIREALRVASKAAQTPFRRIKQETNPIASWSKALLIGIGIAGVMMIAQLRSGRRQNSGLCDSRRDGRF